MLEVFEIIGKNPTLTELITQIQKCMKSLVESNTFPDNTTLYMDRFKDAIEETGKVLGMPMN